MAVPHHGQDDQDLDPEHQDLEHQDPEHRDLDPEPDRHHLASQRFAAVWSIVQPLLQFLELLTDGQHEGLHLVVQALLMLGDLAAVSLARNRRR